MRRFYLLRHQDVHGNSGTGIVAEGVIFDNKLAAMTWLTEDLTVTTFIMPKSIKKLHSHNGLTEMVLEGKDPRFETCREELKAERKRKKEANGSKRNPLV